jgi:hypothetical protein
MMISFRFAFHVAGTCGQSLAGQDAQRTDWRKTRILAAGREKSQENQLLCALSALWAFMRRSATKVVVPSAKPAFATPRKAPAGLWTRTKP